MEALRRTKGAGARVKKVGEALGENTQGADVAIMGVCSRSDTSKRGGQVAAHVPVSTGRAGRVIPTQTAWGIQKKLLVGIG